MSLMAGVERSYSLGGGGFIEQQRSPVPAGTNLNGLVNGQTISLFDVTTALSLATTVVNVASILLPRNLPVFQCGNIVTTAGTVTGYWQGLATQGGIVRAVSANSTAPTTGFFFQSVLPASNVPYVTEYAGLYYYFVGTVSSVASVAAASTAAPTAATFAGPPVYAGTAATAATTTPPAVGSNLGALTGTVGGILFGQVA